MTVKGRLVCLKMTPLGLCSFLVVWIGVTCDDTLLYRPDSQVEPRGNNTICPDKGRCPDHHTCCPHGLHYACCPHPSATCCKDQLHCCPMGTRCNVQAGTCTQESISPDPLQPALLTAATDRHPETQPALVATRGAENTICPDRSRCASGYTCCPAQGRRFGCCHHNSATCCPDHRSCCPHGCHCDMKRRRCLCSAIYPFVLEMVSPAVKPANHQMANQPNPPRSEPGPYEGSLNTICPDRSRCASGYTCCPGPGRRFGCCHHISATCCPDHRSCCPHGCHCDVRQRRCLCSAIYPFVLEMASPAVKPANHQMANQPTPPKTEPGPYEGSPNTICPDGSHCTTGFTCCPAPKGKFGCCHYNSATCCSDRRSCCPHGCHCDLKQRRCLCSAAYPFLIKMSSPAVKPANSQLENQPTPPKTEPGPYEGSPNTICPDGSHCASGFTCCPAGGRFGCCQLTSATCCPDQRSCCPHGCRCDLQQRRCHCSAPYPFLLKRSPIAFTPTDGLSPRRQLILQQQQTQTADGVTNTRCPDGTHCPIKNTCCPRGKKFACCPYASGSCCADQKKCCPHGYKCQRGRCVRGHVPAVFQQPATLLGPN